jgi:transcriptional regulator with XRE-family HTH domain
MAIRREADGDPGKPLRRQKVIELRIAGWSQERIAQDLGLSRRRVRQIIRREIEKARRRLRECADELLQLELDRLDRYLVCLNDRITAGEPRAIEVALKISERRARLMGLDAPERKEVKVQSIDDWADAELVEHAKRLGIGVQVVDGKARYLPATSNGYHLPGEERTGDTV